MLRFSPLFPRRCKVNKACLRSIGWHERGPRFLPQKPSAPSFSPDSIFSLFPLRRKSLVLTLSHSEPNPGLKAKIEGEMGDGEAWGGCCSLPSASPNLIWNFKALNTEGKGEVASEAERGLLWQRKKGGKGMVVCKHASSYFPSWKWSSIFQKVK